MNDIPQPPCPLDLEPYDFFLSQDSRQCYEGGDLMIIATFQNNHQTYLLSFNLCTGQNTLNNGTSIGLAVYSPKETTLK